MDSGKNLKMCENDTLFLLKVRDGDEKKGLSADESKLNEECFNLFLKGVHFRVWSGLRRDSGFRNFGVDRLWI